MHVCIYICLSACVNLKTHTSKFDEIFQWLGLSPTTLQNVMLFRFCGWRHAAFDTIDRNILVTRLSSLFSQLPVPNLHTLFICRYSCSPTDIIRSKSNWLLLSLCFTLSLESTPFISSSTLLYYQFLYFRLTYSLTYHFFLVWFTTLLIGSMSISLCHTNHSLVVSLVPPGLHLRTDQIISSKRFLFLFFIFFLFLFLCRALE